MNPVVLLKALKYSWIPAGFSESGRNYAFKLHLQDGLLTTLLTDYRTIYVEEVILKKRFTELNAKLSGPDDVLFLKVHDLFQSKSSSHMLQIDRQTRTLTVNLETKLGKRMIKWCFKGIVTSENVFYLQIVRPLLDMLTVAVENKELIVSEEVKAMSSLPDPFEKIDVQELYKNIVARPEYQRISNSIEESADLLNSYLVTNDNNDERQIRRTSENQDANQHNISSVPTTSEHGKLQRTLGLECAYKEDEGYHVNEDSCDHDDSLSATPPPVFDDGIKEEHTECETPGYSIQNPSLIGKPGKLSECKLLETPKKLSPKKPRLKF